ncbi:hemagglutinin repeat-containing protein [Serratia sp. UGAL515B_01]|uniref:two-partner secretion domain-containing protein n=1 Tax=Serratia sp. UGAL515B_01 TaxID=2986763 RepID=UPI002954D757|nr:hemagglutinin repeat-containing protein [Serratia sp. UGAL515B_01]WON78255.1 hemagglutinin repeat-containing protein [Serratia sp. UGAL515B_01]
MNKNLYRLIFNPARGMMMVVPDIAGAGRAGAASPASGFGQTLSQWRGKVHGVCFALLLALGAVQPVQAQIVADGSAPGNQQPTVISSANGTPQVNIQTPSAAGVSRNVYSQFDVDNKGVVLNNSHLNTQTQIAGMVTANPWLARGEATVILNEVNARDPSQLNGFIEVAGQKAQVVIANPAGITCSGCGFINAHRATLTTGQPQLFNGQLTGYDVARGEIVVQGGGLDSSRQDHTDLIARAVKVNARLWANDLNVTTGRNQVDAAHQTVSAKTADGSPRPTVAVDVAQLGGMYAGKIRLISTESGVGVHNAGEIGATAGDIVITADGMLVNSGQVNSAQHLTVNTPAGIDNRGALYAGASNRLTTAGTLTNQGTIAAAGDTTLRAAEVDSSRTAVLGAGVQSGNGNLTPATLRVDASGTLRAQGKNLSGSALQFTAQRLDLNGSQTQGDALTLNALGGDIDLSNSQLQGTTLAFTAQAGGIHLDNGQTRGGDVTLNAHGGDITLTGSRAQVRDLTLNVDGGTITARHSQTQGRDLVFNARDGALDFTGSQTQGSHITFTAPGEITLTGATLSASTLAASTASLLRSDNARVMGEQVGLHAQALSNVGGLIAQTGTPEFTLDLTGDFDNRAGTLLSQGNLTLNAQRLLSDSQSLLAAGVQNNGRLADRGDLRVATRQDLQAVGQTLASGTLALSGSQLEMNDSQLQAREMHLTAREGDINTQRATLTALDTLSLTANGNAGQTLDNQGGTLSARTVSLALGQLNNDAGRITASEDLTLGLQGDFTHQAGAWLQVGRDLTLTTPGAVTNAGQIIAGGTLNTHTGNLENSGSLVATQASLTSAGALTNRGEVQVNGRLETDVTTLFNTGTLISGDGTLRARERITNSGPQALIGATDENGTLALLAPVIENSDTVTDTDTAPSTTLLGMGNLVLAGGQDEDGQYRAAAQVLNISGLIESGKDLRVEATTLTNRRHILTADSDFVVADTQHGSAFWTPDTPDIPGGRYAEPPHGGSMNSDYIGTDYTSTLAYNHIDRISPEAQLLAGGDLTARVGTLENYWSKVSAQGAIDLTGVTLLQDGWGSAQRLMERTTSTGQWNYRTYKGELWSTAWGPEVKEQATSAYASSLTAHTISGSGVTLNNGATPGTVAPPSVRDNTGKAFSVEFNGLSLTPPSGGLYRFSVDPSVNSHYLIETNPAFANLNQWRGSDTVLAQLSTDPNRILKRLGDNAYEQRLVRDQVLALTGRAVMADYRDAQAQFEQLFADGLQYSQAFNIALGTGLSAEQMATLTHNIVLMETREVAGQTVLVPVVYLAGVKPGDLRANGAVIAAEDIRLTNMQGFTNAGAVTATRNLSLDMAKDVTLDNRGGLLQAGNTLQLGTLNSDIDLSGARLNAGSLRLDSGRDVLLRTETTLYGSDNGAVQRTDSQLGPLASITVSDGATINAQRDFIQQGASLTVGQDLQVTTGGDWVLNTTQTRDRIDTQYGGGSATSEHRRHLGSTVTVGGALNADVTHLTATGANLKADTVNVQAQGITLQAATDSLQVTGESSSQRHTSAVNLYDETLQGSQLSAKGDVRLNAAQDIALSASAIRTDGALNLAAGGNVTLSTQNEQHDAYRQHTGTSKGVLSSTTTHTEDSLSQTWAVGSLLSAGAIDVSGKNIAVSGSQVVADNDLALRAKESLTVTTAQQRESESHRYEQSKSGVMSTGGLGVMVGSSKTTMTDTGSTLSSVGSTVGSLMGNVTLSAGEDLTVKGSDVMAGKDLSLSGSSVSVLAAEHQSAQRHTVEQQQSGLTVALSGAAGGAVNTAVTTARQANKETDSRLAALQHTQAVLSGVQAGQAVGVELAKGGDARATVGLSASLGSQTSASDSQSQSTTAAGSTLTAGNNLSITATGKGTGSQKGDITVLGSQLKAGGDTTLSAERDVLLGGVANTQQTTGSNSGSGFGVGLDVSTAGVMASANANKSQGAENGNGTQWTETTIDSGNTVRITSGRDTTLTGAQVSGDTINLDVGRDLTLRSQQDSDRYDAHQSSMSGGLSVPVGPGAGGGVQFSTSRDKVNSNYDSVQEQTGLFAGKGGFDITVGNHTQLDGAVIASQADTSKNRLDTGTLGFSDIDNKADFKTEHQGGSFSTGGSRLGNVLSNSNNLALSGANHSGSAEGTTQAAIAEGTITIRDKDNQQQDIADLSRDTENANGSIAPIFDKEKEQNRLREAQLIGAIGGQAMDIARTQGQIAGLNAQKDPAALQAAREQLVAKGKPFTEADVQQQAYNTAMAQWGTGSAIQQGIQAATAAIQGLAGGNMAQALSGAAAPYLAEQIHKLAPNEASRAMAHAVVGAVTAYASGNNAAAGAAGAVSGELMAQLVLKQLYPGRDVSNLSESERQTISMLGTLAAGLAGGVTGDSSASALAGAQAGKNAVENNSLSRGCNPLTCKAIVDPLEGGGGIIGGGGLSGGVGKPKDKQIWSETKKKEPVSNAYGHWDKHKKEFPEYQNSKQYVDAAHNFVNNPPSGTLTKVRPNGETVFYNPTTNTFAVQRADGVPRTMFRPDPADHGFKTNLDYFNAQ